MKKNKEIKTEDKNIELATKVSLVEKINLEIREIEKFIDVISNDNPITPTTITELNLRYNSMNNFDELSRIRVNDTIKECVNAMLPILECKLENKQKELELLFKS